MHNYQFQSCFRTHQLLHKRLSTTSRKANPAVVWSCLSACFSVKTSVKMHVLSVSSCNAYNAQDCMTSALFALTVCYSSQDSAWASKSMRSAYIKAVHVARFAQGAHTARQRHEQQQQQVGSSLLTASRPNCAWPQPVQHRQMSITGAAVADGASCAWPTATSPSQRGHSAASASSSSQGPACSSLQSRTTLGKPPIFKRLPSSNTPGSVHSRHSSAGHGTALADNYPQPLARRPSTVANHIASCHASPPNLLSHARRPATVDSSHLQGSLHRRSSDACKSHKTDALPAKPTTPAALLQETHTDDKTSFKPPVPASPLGKALIRAESGSLDSAMQHRSQTPPEQIWRAAIKAADLGHLQESEQARFSRLPDPHSPRHPQTCLTATTMLAFVQGELTTSNDSSPNVSPRPPSRAVDYVPDLKAHCALADSNSPGITPRLRVHMRDIGVGRFEAHPLDAEQDFEQAKERCSLLAQRLGRPAAVEMHREGPAACPITLLQHQVG